LLRVLGDPDVVTAEIVVRALPGFQVTVDFGGTGGRVVFACCVRGIVGVHQSFRRSN